MSSSSKQNPLIAESEFVRESVNEEGTRIIHRRIVRGDDLCHTCSIIRWAIIALGGAIVIHYLYPWLG